MLPMVHSKELLRHLVNDEASVTVVVKTYDEWSNLNLLVNIPIR
jgi:hypothetical protein